MKTCPDCNKFYSGFKCKCGFKEPFNNRSSSSPFTEGHPDAQKCIWRDNGVRCQSIGTMGDVHAGSVEPPENRPFYCPWHFEVKEDSTFPKDKQRVEAFFKRMKSYEPKSITLKSFEREDFS
jgi:hypothetical protein